MTEDRAVAVEADEADEDEKKLESVHEKLLQMLEDYRASHKRTRELKERYLMELDDPEKKDGAEIGLRQVRHLEESDEQTRQLLDQNLADLHALLKHNELVRLTKEQVRAARSSADAAEKLNRFTGALVVVGIGQMVFALAQVLAALLKKC